MTKTHKILKLYHIKVFTACLIHWVYYNEFWLNCNLKLTLALVKIQKFKTNLETIETILTQKHVLGQLQYDAF